MKFILAATLFSISHFSLFAQQYTVNGNAQQLSCNCYLLTQAFPSQSGSVWNNNRIDLSNNFDFNFDVYLGNLNSPGADGIAFVLQPISTSVGSVGGGMGVQGISPSIAVTLDTYQNSNPDSDPYFDHIAIQRNGDINHASSNNLSGPVQASAISDNIEDGLTHQLRITWDATGKVLTAYFDGIQRLSLTNDIVATTFGGNTMLYWGFTGATGGEWNQQRFCTALTPAWNLLPGQNRCVGQPIQFMNSSISFTTIVKTYWDFGDGSGIDSVNLNPVHTYTAAGTYTVIQKIRGADGCEQTNSQTLVVGSKPYAGFTLSDSCVGNTISFTDVSTVSVGTINKWYWNFDDAGITSTLQNPVHSYSTYGIKNIRLAVQSAEGCLSDTLELPRRIYALPLADFSFTDSLCLGSAYTFNATASAPDGFPVTQWQWLVDGNMIPGNAPVLNHNFTTPGNHTVSLSTGTINTAACMSTPIVKNVFVAAKPQAAMQPVSGCQNTLLPVQDASSSPDGLPITAWWWSLDNGQYSTQQNPTVSYSASGIYTIKQVVWNSKGCPSDTTIAYIKVYAAPSVDFVFSAPQCQSSQISFTDVSVADTSITQWNWIYQGNVFSTAQHPIHSFAAGTSHTVGLQVTDAAGCTSDTLQHSFLMKTNPMAAMQFSDACNNELVLFTAQESGSSIGLQQYFWDFGDGSGWQEANPAQHIYTANGQYLVRMVAYSTEGCTTDTLSRNITIYGTNAHAGADVIAASNEPVQLQASGGISYQWSPPAGLSATNISNPVATNNTDRTYYLRAFTPEGCESFDTLHIKIYKGPDIYVPTAFTPNGDGRNDVLKPFAVGISSFHYFAIYNRYGEPIFKSAVPTQGWDGTLRGKAQPGGTYVWMVSGVDFNGNKIVKKGTAILIR